MGSLRTRLCSLVILLIPSGQAPALYAQSQTDPTPLLATCTGRFSALIEFQWLTQDPGSDATKVRRDAMAALLDAAMAPNEAVRTMALRVEAKQATAALLRAGQFGRDPVRAHWARQQAGRMLAACANLMIS